MNICSLDEKIIVLVKQVTYKSNVLFWDMNHLSIQDKLRLKRKKMTKKMTHILEKKSHLHLPIVIKMKLNFHNIYVFFIK
jgi:transcription initiation factor IIE alpha subunit